MILVNNGNMSSIHSLNRLVGIGSSSQYLFGDFSTIFLTSTSVIDLNSESWVLNFGSSCQSIFGLPSPCQGSK